VRPEGIPITLAEAAKQANRSERTIQRWITARLLTSYRTRDGQRVVMIADVKRVERDQRRRNASRIRHRDERLNKLRAVS
jgi:hypothetical protein